MKQTLLITGGLGYVGSRLTPHLLDLGYRVKVIDLGLYGKEGLHPLKKYPKEQFEWISGDIRNPQDVSQAVKDVDTVIHLAAISNDPTGAVDEILTRQVNFDAVGLLLCLSKKAGVQRFISASSSSVFGARKESQIQETLEPEPITAYSKYKMLSEWLVTTAASPQFCTVSIRPATVCGYSPRQRFDLTVNKLTVDAFTKKLITVHGGEQRRPNVGMTDMIQIYSDLITCDPEKINGRVFNFGFENLKVKEIAELIQRQLSDLSVQIQVTETQDLRDYHISSQKALDVLNYQPRSSIAQEVTHLRTMLEAGVFKDSEDASYYNMKSMKLERNPSAYEFLSR